MMVRRAPFRHRITPVASAGSLLRIDELRAVEVIEAYLRNILAKDSASGVVLGLSGGLDSTVLATLAVRSLGKESVHARYLYDRDSDRELGRNARLVADSLGLELQAIDIEPAMQERGIYTPLVIAITSVFGFMTRFIHWSYRLIYGETPYVTLLRAGSTESRAEEHQGSGFNLISRYPGASQAAFSARHVYRRELLEQEASAQNWLLLGAGNRTEWLVGWFAVGGIDDVPIQPFIGLYKTQVRQLASFLGVPDRIQTQAPSPDMQKGLTDEFALGMSYSRIDIALDFLEGGMSEQEVVAAGVGKEDVHWVRELKRLSSWRRRSEHMPPPVDGGPSGGFRLQDSASR